MSEPLVEPEQSSFCPIHKHVKTTRVPRMTRTGETRYVIICPICGVTDKL